MTTTRSASDATWRTVDIVVAAVVAVAFGVVFVAWNALYVAATPFFTVLPPAQAILYGVWLLPGVLVGLIVRRPGAALFGGFVAAVVSTVIGSQWGSTPSSPEPFRAVERSSHSPSGCIASGTCHSPCSVARSPALVPRSTTC